MANIMAEAVTIEKSRENIRLFLGGMAIGKKTHVIKKNKK